MRWDGIRWDDATVVILASGPSLTEAQCAAVKAWRDAGEARRVIAINTTFRRAPWADVLYACDAQWWIAFRKEVDMAFAGERWTQDELAVVYGVRRIASVRGKGLSRTPGVIHQGGNSGYQAINLAWQAGAARILLLGFDMQGTHWHGRYGNGLANTAAHLFEQWLVEFKPLAADLKTEGIDVVNCTPGGRLECFPRAALSEELT